MNSNRVLWRKSEADAVKEAESLRSRFPHDTYSVRSFRWSSSTHVCWEVARGFTCHCPICRRHTVEMTGL